MAHDASILPSPSPEHRRVAAGQFERANQVIAKGDFDYGIRLLLSCCKLDPANLVYRQALRRTQKLKHKNNLRGHWLAWLTNAPAKARIKKAMVARDPGPADELLAEASRRESYPKLRETIEEARRLVAAVRGG